LSKIIFAIFAFPKSLVHSGDCFVGPWAGLCQTKPLELAPVHPCSKTQHLHGNTCLASAAVQLRCRGG